MKFKAWLAGVLIVLCTGSLAMAQDASKKEMSPEEKAMMELWLKAMTPGDAHKALNQFVGKWDTKVSTWMAPGAPPQVSTGTSENKWILGNRYLEQRFDGTFMGQPFSGLGYTGYDNVSKQYWGTWMDNMSTGVMSSVGTGSDGKSWTFTATMNDAMTGKPSTSDEKITVVDADHHTMEMWSAGPDGRKFKMMQIDYTRKK